MPGYFFAPYIFITFFLTSIGYGISARTVDDFLEYPVLLGLAMWALLIPTFIAAPFWRPFSWSNLRRNIGGILLWIPLSIFLGFVYYCFGVFFLDFYTWLRNPFSSSRSVMFLAAVVSVSIGVVLYYIRLKRRFFYGISEALIGVVVTVHRVSLQVDPGLPSDTGFYLAVLTAGIYLIVRGLDNAHLGFKDNGDPMVIWVKRRLSH